jgi:RNA polymerase sigma-B factor
MADPRGESPAQARERVAAQHRVSDEVRRQRTAALFAAAADSSAQARLAIHQRIVLEHLEIAEVVARRYAGQRADWSDLKQVASLGLIKAVKGFDLSKGSDFVAYCVPTITGEVKRHLRDRGWFVRPPRSVQDLRARILEESQRLTQALGREPSARDLADALSVGLYQVTEALQSEGSLRPASLDISQDVDGDDPARPHSLLQVIVSDDAVLARAEMRVLVVQACRGLTDRERHILYRRYFEDWTQAQIALELRVTQMQVSRLLATILTKLRRELSIPVPPPAAPGEGRPVQAPVRAPKDLTAEITSATVTANSAGSG